MTDEEMIEQIEKKAVEYAESERIFDFQCYDGALITDLLGNFGVMCYVQGQTDYQNGLTVLPPKTYLEMTEKIKKLEEENKSLKEDNEIHNTICFGLKEDLKRYEEDNEKLRAEIKGLKTVLEHYTDKSGKKPEFNPFYKQEQP